MTDAQIVAVIGVLASAGSAILGGLGVKIVTVFAERKEVDVRVSQQAIKAADMMIERLQQAIERADARAERAEEKAALVEERLSALKRQLESEGL